MSKHLKKLLEDIDLPEAAILENGKVVKTHIVDASLWMADNDQPIRLDRIDESNTTISTVFYIIPFNWKNQKSLHFETMISTPDSSVIYDRYATLEEAVKGHETALEQLRKTHD